MNAVVEHEPAHQVEALVPLIGVHDDLSNEAYHKVGALSASGLKKLAVSPAHFFAAFLDPARPVIEPSPAMRAGTLAHTAILEPEALSDRYVTVPDNAPSKPTAAQWAAKKPSADSQAAMEWWGDFTKTSSGKEIISAEAMLVALRQRAAVRAHPDIEYLLDSAQFELSAFCLDEATGCLLKARPDAVRAAGEGVILFDLKTAQSAAPAEFARSCVTYGYSLQCAHYAAVYAAAADVPVVGFVFCAVESQPPFAVALYTLSEEWIARAERRRRALISLYCECRSSGVWPGYQTGCEELLPPRWLRDDDC